ncbi:hypothetical protein LT493_14055 [Streptomyces tricolor]|nr:hypothetical protein [Streptomyces tricolor]
MAIHLRHRLAAPSPGLRAARDLLVRLRLWLSARLWALRAAPARRRLRAAVPGLRRVACGRVRLYGRTVAGYTAADAAAADLEQVCALLEAAGVPYFLVPAEQGARGAAAGGRGGGVVPCRGPRRGPAALRAQCRVRRCGGRGRHGDERGAVGRRPAAAGAARGPGAAGRPGAAGARRAGARRAGDGLRHRVLAVRPGAGRGPGAPHRARHPAPGRLRPGPGRPPPQRRLGGPADGGVAVGRGDPALPGRGDSAPIRPR